MVVAIANYAYAPDPVTIAAGSTLTWRYDGPDTNHSVTSVEGQADAFDSDPGRLPTALDHLRGSTYSRRFDVAGTFRYFCKVHPSMRATVVVTAPVGPPAPGSPADVVAPVISGVEAVGGRAPALALRLSEAARVTVVLARGATTRKLIRKLARGRASIRLPRGLPAGRYALTVRARDAAGNAATPRKVALRVAAPG